MHGGTLIHWRSRSPGFPDLSKAYRASNLFPAFRSRAMNRSRPDLPEYLGALGFHSRNPDVIEELAVSGGHSAKDSYETFPAIEPDRAGRFDARFIVHGLRHEDRISAGKVDSLKPGDRLRLLLESSAPYRSTVVKVATEDEYRLGWLPRYLADVFGRVNRWVVNDVAVRVAQVNPEAPLSHRLLVALKGRLPPGGDPVGELEQYQPISND